MLKGKVTILVKSESGDITNTINRPYVKGMSRLERKAYSTDPLIGKYLSQVWICSHEFPTRVVRRKRNKIRSKRKRIVRNKALYGGTVVIHNIKEALRRFRKGLKNKLKGGK